MEDLRALRGLKETCIGELPEAMKNHLYRCFNKGELRMFLATHRDVQATVLKVNCFIERFCSCRMPESMSYGGMLSMQTVVSH